MRGWVGAMQPGAEIGGGNSEVGGWCENAHIKVSRIYSKG
jgi:hypothetical protein